MAGLLFPLVAMLSAQPPHMPFVMTAAARRILMFVLSVPLLPIGVGLWFRLKAAWYAMFGYLTVGTILHAIAFGFCTPAEEGGGALLALVVVLFDVSLIVGLYFVTWPVFSGSHQTDGRP